MSRRGRVVSRRRALAGGVAVVALAGLPAVAACGTGTGAGESGAGAPGSATASGSITFMSRDNGTALASAYNSWTVDTWLTQHNPDGRFKASLLVAPQDPPAAAAEIDRLGAHPHFVQVLMTSALGAPMGHKQFHPIYEAAQRHGLPVAVHPGSEGRGVAGAPTAAGGSPSTSSGTPASPRPPRPTW